jgi:hypothetical protein
MRLYWRNFNEAVQAAMKACEASGQATSDHFDARVKMIPIGKGGRRQVEDWHPSRYACYLVVPHSLLRHFASVHAQVVLHREVFFIHIPAGQATCIRCLAGASSHPAV